MYTEFKQKYYKQERKCWRKKTFGRTLKEGRRAARLIYKRVGLRLYPYICSGCGNIHLTKQISAKGKVI